MLKNLRAALAPVGGVQTLIALAAVAWGLGRLQVLADERQEQLDRLEEATKAYEDALRAAQAAMNGHLDTLEQTLEEDTPEGVTT